MTELDFSREGTDHSMSHLRGPVPSAEDHFTRTKVLPRLWKLDENQREEFDDQFVLYFAPELPDRGRAVAQGVLRSLSLPQLEYTASILDAFLERQGVEIG